MSISSAKNSYQIASIPEASGISYCSDNDRLIVANDEGWYYEMKTNGDIVSKKRLGEYDLEGVVCEEDRMIFAIEDRGILIVDRATHKIKEVDIEPIYRGKKLPLFEKKRGIEGIARVDDFYYLAKQSKKRRDSFVAVVKLDRYHAKIVDLIKHKVADTAGLEYHNGSLYMVSDKRDLLIRYDIKREKIICKVKLDKSAQEGITFDNSGNVYIADDGGAVLKYPIKDFGKKCSN
ncbi:hypothetical protein MNB_SV-6-1511 [hydrothermal vent metagenome]|uniref:Uncharacterized protein n=1 Tax=hydrothermal vent metagenome TaxID=652676 RepID=A0A1W1CEX9_9ZZZZ